MFLRKIHVNTCLTCISVFEFNCDFHCNCIVVNHYPVVEEHQMAKICDLEFLVNAFLQMMRVFHIVIRDYSFATLNYSVIPERQGSVHSFLAWERARGREREGEGEREQERENRKNKLFFLILQKHLMRDKLCSLNSCKYFAKPSQFF